MGLNLFFVLLTLGWVYGKVYRFRHAQPMANVLWRVGLTWVLFLLIYFIFITPNLSNDQVTNFDSVISTIWGIFVLILIIPRQILWKLYPPKHQKPI